MSVNVKAHVTISKDFCSSSRVFLISKWCSNVRASFDCDEFKMSINDDLKIMNVSLVQ